MKTFEDYYQEFSQKFSVVTDDRLAEIYNSRVHTSKEGPYRQSYLKVMREEFLKRNIDFSVTIGDDGFTLMYIVVLKNKKLIF